MIEGSGSSQKHVVSKHTVSAFTKFPAKLLKADESVCIFFMLIRKMMKTFCKSVECYWLYPEKVSAYATVSPARILSWM